MKKLFILLTAVLLTWGAGAQNLITVTGTVVDKNGEPVIGAALQEKGTNQAAMTGLDGEFSLQVTSANAVLHVSCIGYKGKDVPLDGRFTLRLELEEDLLMISESVVTALGIKREAKALGYAVATAGSEEISGANERKTGRRGHHHRRRRHVRFHQRHHPRRLPAQRVQPAALRH